MMNPELTIRQQELEPLGAFGAILAADDAENEVAMRELEREIQHLEAMGHETREAFYMVGAY